MIAPKDVPTIHLALSHLYAALSALNDAAFDADQTISTIADNVDGEVAELVSYLQQSTGPPAVQGPAVVPAPPAPPAMVPPVPPVPAARTRPTRPLRG